MDVQILARAHTTAAIAALVDALSSPRERVAAACAILDRGYGKPPTTVDVFSHRAVADASDAELLEIAMSGRDDPPPDGTLH